MFKIYQLQLFTQGNLGMEILYQKAETPQSFFRNCKEWGCQGIPLLALSFVYRFTIFTLSAGQESMLQSKLGRDKIVLISITFSPKPVVVLKHKIMK